MRVNQVFWLLTTFLLIGSCAGSAGDHGAFELFEYGITGPAKLHPGTQTVVATNAGEFAHTLVVTDASGAVEAATPLISPGEQAELGLDLDPGSYSVTCRIVAEGPDGEIFDHFERGMSTSVVVDG